MSRDTFSGVVLMALAAAYYWASRAIADSTLSDEVGATGLPHMLAIALAGLGLILLVRSLLLPRPAKAPRSAGEGEDRERENAALPRAAGFLLFGVAYVLILPYVGYVVGVALLIGAVALYEGAPRRWTVPAAAIGGAVLYWAIFVKLLGVNQPVGTLFRGMF
jgi:putative tricarboxylic transport membrane protein